MGIRMGLSSSRQTGKLDCATQPQIYIDNISQQVSTDQVEGRDNFYQGSQSDSLLGLPMLVTTQTREPSHDDDFLLPARSGSQHTQNAIKRNRLSGWRTGALVSLTGALLVLLVNLAITIWVRADPRNEIRGAVGTMYRGDCAKTRSMNIWIHLLVNVS